jgi:hypothetical protein
MPIMRECARTRARRDHRETYRFDVRRDECEPLVEFDTDPTRLRGFAAPCEPLVGFDTRFRRGSAAPCELSALTSMGPLFLRSIPPWVPAVA